jgi:succinate dehydrogenase / fumarate reductase iron-sulfur subunit
MKTTIDLTLKVWRQKNSKTRGAFEMIRAKGVDTDMSFLEMLDVVNEKLTLENRDPIAFDHDCREGICGTCGAVVNGQPHGPDRRGTTLCQLYMRHFKDGQTLIIEPLRARAFVVNKDLSVDRSSFDRIIASGGFISVKTGQAPDAHAIPISKEVLDTAMDAAACIGCGACVAACPNGSAMLFVAAKLSHLNGLPQGAPEKKTRVLNMVKQMDKEGFGSCSNSYECEAACPKQISVAHIARMNKDYRCQGG